MDFYFCRNCRYLSKFSLPKSKAMQLLIEENDLKAEYECQRCNQNTIKQNLETQLFGIAIDKSLESSEMEKSRLSIQSVCCQEMLNIDETHQVKIYRELECSICLKLIDMSANLQCLKCKHLFCFYCLIKWLEANSKCPLCCSEIIIDTLGTNSNLISTFNLMVDVVKSQDAICKLHQQRSDLYCNCCKKEICYECILSNKHKTHVLVSLKTLVKETKDQCKALSEPENSIQSFVESQIDTVDLNQDILHKIIGKCFDASFKAYNDFKTKFYKRIDKIHTDIKNKLTLNAKKGEINQIKINAVAEGEKFDNLNDVVMEINKRSEIELDTLTIVKEYQQSCIEEQICLVDPPIKKTFEIKMKQFKNSDSITLNIKYENLNINQLYFKKFDQKTWDIYARTEDLNGIDCYILVKIFKKDYFNLQSEIDILKMQQNGRSIFVNCIIFDEGKDKPCEKIKIELNYWRMTDKLSSYMKECEDSIKKGLQKLFN